MPASALRKPRPIEEVRHNAAGQRLGRKGQETRERILAAALRLFEDPLGPPVTLTSVAREASVSLSNFYLYFPDFVDLVLALLDRVMADSQADYIEVMRTRWSDDDLSRRCLLFLEEHYQFWRRHTRLLHLRNTLSESDARVMEYRQRAIQPILQFLAMQMDHGAGQGFTCADLAMVLLIGFERTATIVTAARFEVLALEQANMADDNFVDRLICGEARMLELAIRDCRAQRRMTGSDHN